MLGKLGGDQLWYHIGNPYKECQDSLVNVKGRLKDRGGEKVGEDHFSSRHVQGCNGMKNQDFSHVSPIVLPLPLALNVL